mmetsp:Transcript_63303/g.196016  ORF Transcript_63303/g.196016 Transcript_63303/m.196016 type:complete len:297 (+) Transcript_63303:1211-2101(+)
MPRVQTMPLATTSTMAPCTPAFDTAWGTKRIPVPMKALKVAMHAFASEIFLGAAATLASRRAGTGRGGRPNRGDPPRSRAHSSSRVVRSSKRLPPSPSMYSLSASSAPKKRVRSRMLAAICVARASSSAMPASAGCREEALRSPRPLLPAPVIDAPASCCRCTNSRRKPPICVRSLALSAASPGMMFGMLRVMGLSPSLSPKRRRSRWKSSYSPVPVVVASTSSSPMAQGAGKQTPCLEPHQHGGHKHRRKRDTGGTCYFGDCDASRGVTRCGAKTHYKCMCKRHFKAVQGVCVHR